MGTLADAEAGGTMSESETENEVTALVAKLGVRLVYGIYSLILLSTIAAFSVGVIFARNNAQIDALNNSMEDMRRLLGEDVAVRLRTVESILSIGVLPETQSRLADHEHRIRKLEHRE
jgi:hypothetical protein